MKSIFHGSFLLMLMFSFALLRGKEERNSETGDYQEEYSEQAIASALSDEDILDESLNDLADEQRINDLIGDANINMNAPPKESLTCDHLSPADLLTFLVEALPQSNLLTILQQDLYKRTNRIAVRDVLDLVSLIPDYFCYCGGQFFVQPFYNQTSRIFLKHHINIQHPVIAREVTKILSDINTLLPNPVDVNVPEILKLFKNFRLQERRAGGMFSFAQRYKHMFFSFRIPLYYMEHNFFLSHTERHRIENYPLFKVQGMTMTSDVGNPNREIEKILQTILVNDRVGLGDSRVKLLFNIADNDIMHAWFGLQSTLPTAVDFKVGIFGSRFKIGACPPFLEIKSIVDLIFCNMLDKAKDLGVHFGFEALRRLSTILINVPLGQEKHFRVGPYLEAKGFIDNYWSTNTTARFDYFFPKRHKRFFRAIKHAKEFKRNLADEEHAEQNLAFIDTQLNNTVFPKAMCVDVFPGYIIQVNHAFLFDTPCWHTGFGFDFWFQSKEVLGLKKSNDIGIIHGGMVRATRPHVYQGKIFSEIGYHGTSHQNICWEVLLASDITVLSKDIGKDFTIGVRVGINY